MLLNLILYNKFHLEIVIYLQETSPINCALCKNLINPFFSRQENLISLLSGGNSLNEEDMEGIFFFRISVTGWASCK